MGWHGEFSKLRTSLADRHVQSRGGVGMDSEKNQVGIAIAAVITSGLCLFFGTGLHPVWWLMWLAPIPVLVAAPQLTRRWTFAVAFVAWALGGLNMWNYLH